MNPLVCALPGNEALAGKISGAAQGELAHLLIRKFPDQETYVRVMEDAAGRDAIVVAALDHPNQKLVDIGLLATALKQSRARRVLLVAPYLPYMRQDQAFNPGEGASARYLGELLSLSFDGLLTVDPHLHRIHALNEVFRMPCHIVRAAPAIGDWVKREVPNPLLIGPDAESEPWVAEAAQIAGCSYLVMRKTRLGDREVRLELPDLQSFAGSNPVVLDDIISSGATLTQTIRELCARGLAPPTCIAVHALFAERASQMIEAAQPRRVVSCNTVPHPSNAIDLHGRIAEAAAGFLSQLN